MLEGFDLSLLNGGDIAALSSIGAMFLVTIVHYALGLGSKETKVIPVEQKDKRELKTTAKEEIKWKDRLNKGLAKSRNDVWGKIGNIFTRKKLDQDSLDEIEELLFSSDMSPAIVDELIEKYKNEVKKDEAGLDNFKDWTFKFLNSKLEPVQEEQNQDLFSFDPSNKKLKVFMVVGINGAGKTTTIGKLATKLKNQGAKVVVGACDTFRAAAVEQLEVWCKRAEVEMIRAKEGADPSGVAYDALAKAKALNADYCLLDTAGRIHTKQNLMKELGKTKSVLSKIDASAPHEVLLVIDSITGQNAINQALEFHKALELTGLVLTKCDGSSKAGNAVSIVDRLKVPIAYIGVGESVDDLEVFKSDEYLSALLYG